ncbi:unnamed protein product [Schistocephalus solidus]|uniref:Transposase n=1 Tax=Schistocephalus solidus TaxID=70667 RepID=A0A183TCA0_SCHSO|nr:unnamed protein product [Schistocephalus solidus]
MTSSQPLPISPAHTAPATSNSSIGLVGHLRIHRTEAGEPVPSRIGLFGHLRIHRTEAGEPVPGLRHIFDALAFTALTALAHLHTAWAYSDTCASTTTCGKPPQAKLHHRTLPTPIHRQHPHSHHLPEGCQSDASTRPRRRLSFYAVCRVADQWTGGQTAMAPPYPLSK